MKISDDPGTAAQTKARIGVDSANNLVAAWIDARTSPAHVRVARKPSGGSWSASIDISPSPANAQSLALSVRPDGFAWATWGDTRAGATNQDIWGSRYDPNLNTWSAPVRLDDDPGTSANQLNPAVAFGSAEVMLAWRDNRLSANGDTQARRIQVLSGMSDHFVLSYDGLNRLTKVTGPVSETFGLDGPSNVTSRSGTTETYDKANRLTDDGALHNTWSDADRLTQRGSDTFIYDPLDRMTTSNVGGTARTYTYNGDGLLQTRTGGVGASFLWDPSTSPSRELKQNNDNIVYGLGPLYVVKADASTLTLARDGSRSIRSEVNTSGAVSGAFRYKAYGQIVQQSGAPGYLGYVGQLTDPTNLIFMRARWYDPLVGRFLTRDPFNGDPQEPATLNGYAYTGGNPLRFADVTGKCFIICLEDLRLGFGWLTSSASVEGGVGPAASGAMSYSEISFETVFENGRLVDVPNTELKSGGMFSTVAGDTVSAPPGNDSGAVGGYAGAAWGAFVANTTNPDDLLEGFHTIKYDVGVGPIGASFDFSYSDTGVWIFTIGSGPGLGLAGVKMETYTVRK